MVLAAASTRLETAPAVLEIGMVLLLAVGAGWVARRLGLPAVLGYLGVGLIVSPFTPGYVADRNQLQVLADVGVVLLLFEVGIEVNPLRLVREHRAVLWAAPAQVIVTSLASGGLALLFGVSLPGSAMIGLSIALSSSVVVVNITRSRRRTTNPATEAALLSWSVMQDMTGVAFALVLLAGLGLADRPAPAAAGAATVGSGTSQAMNSGLPGASRSARSRASRRGWPGAAGAAGAASAAAPAGGAASMTAGADGAADVRRRSGAARRSPAQG